MTSQEEMDRAQVTLQAQMQAAKRVDAQATKRLVAHTVQVAAAETIETCQQCDATSDGAGASGSRHGGEGVTGGGGGGGGGGGSKESLLCPITQELMADPVIASDGHAYEREAILNAWAAGRERHANPQNHMASCGAAVAPFALLSPVTNEPVSPRLTAAHIIVALTEALVNGGASDLPSEEAADWRERRAAVTAARRSGVPARADPSDLVEHAEDAGRAERAERAERAGPAEENVPGSTELLRRVVDTSTPATPATGRSSRGRLGATASTVVGRVRRSLSFDRFHRSPRPVVLVGNLGAPTSIEGGRPEQGSAGSDDGGAAGAVGTAAAAGDAAESAAQRRLRLQIGALEEQLPAQRTRVASASGQAAQETAVLELSRIEFELETARVELAGARSLHSGLSRSLSFGRRQLTGAVYSAMETCQQVRQAAEARRGRRKKAVDGVSKLLRTELRSGLTKPCPCCQLPITKNGGCHHHTCPACQTRFCWRCGRYNQQAPHRSTCGSTCSRPPRVWWKEGDVMAHYRRQMAA